VPWPQVNGPRGIQSLDPRMSQRLSFGSGWNYQEEDAIPIVDDYGGLDDNHTNSLLGHDENGAHHRKTTVQDSQQLWLLQQGTLAIRKASKALQCRLLLLFQLIGSALALIKKERSPAV
jgi:hypothetical protein